MKAKSIWCGLVIAIGLCAVVSRAYAWDPPDGPASDQATLPSTALVHNAHGYLIQTGISVLYNDGYWAAAQFLQAQQQELLNGVRYADEKDGRQGVYIEECEFSLFDGPCQNLAGPDIWPTYKDWPGAADNHYYNPDTGNGLDTSTFHDLLSAAQIPSDLMKIVDLDIYEVQYAVEPDLEFGYPSSGSWFRFEYQYAISAFQGTNAFGQPVASINGRQGLALAMFYLGWASHLMQDATVVHHTFDAPSNHHADYEAAADGLVTVPPVANGQPTGIYWNQLPASATSACTQPADRACYVTYAAGQTHDINNFNRASNGDYSGVNTAIPFAQRLQAGLYAAFLTDIGRPPVHMSAMMRSTSLTLL
jgi:hypothetical protein